MLPEEQERKKNKRKLRRQILITIAVLIFVIVAIAMNSNVLVKWFIPSPGITIVLHHPNANETLAVATTYFNWTGVGGDGTPLSYEWYCDVVNTFNSPLLMTMNTAHVGNYTPPPFNDGTYYWRAEATDGTIVNVSATRKFVVHVNPGNGFPHLINNSVTPIAGDDTITYVYKVTFFDPDNDAGVITVFINAVPFVMTETDPADVLTTDGKNFTYSTLLIAGAHSYMMTCTDGLAVNNTPVVNAPIVTASTPGTNPPTQPEPKMNKITIKPINIISYPAGNFEGTISITEESANSSEYEIYWYLALINQDEIEVEIVNGALAIQTTVVVAYNIKISDNISLGNYRLVAKTYDHPREQLVAEQLGMDSVDVEIEKAPFGLSIYDFLVLNTWLLILMIILAVILAVIAWKKKKGYILVFAVGISMILLVVFHVVQLHYFSFIGISLTMFGGFMFTKSFQKLFNIKRFKFIKIIGALLIFAGVVLYFKMLW